MSFILALFYLFVIILIFYLLTRVCTHYFVESLEILARKLKLSEDIAGATLMAFGGSAPEFLIVVITLLHPGNHANFGAGAIIGSAIFNILVVIGAAAIIHTAQLSWKPVIRDVVFYISAIIALFLVFQDGEVRWYEALLLVALYLVYLTALRTWQKFIPKEDKQILLDELSDEVEKHESFFLDRWLGKIFKDLDKEPQYYRRVFVLSLCCIALLSWTLVEVAIRLSALIGIPDDFVALTIVAIGTSIPDLVSAMFVSRQGHGGMAIADALGSNIFDVLFGFGLPWLLYTLVVGHSLIVSTENLNGAVILLLATVAMILLLLLLRHFKIGKPVGILLISCYGIYLAYTFFEILCLK
jgi:K+-dependent Na+/Ca+ exchanger-like protein